MSHTLTETATFTSTVTVPDDGDQRDAASVGAPFQALANRSTYLKQRVDALEADNLDARLDTLESQYINGNLLGPEIMYTTSATQILVEAQHLFRIGTAFLYEPGAVTFTPTLYSTSTWHYVYAYNNAGSIAYESSPIAPGSNRIFKGGDATRRYVGSFYVNAANTIRPFRKTGKEYLWQHSATSENLSVGSAGTTLTAHDFSSFVSPLSRIAKVFLTLYNTTNDAALCQVRTAGDTASYFAVLGPVLAEAKLAFEKDFIVNSSRQLSTQILAAGGSPVVALVSSGYVE